jgi:ribosome biogenesis protein Nip4
MKQFIRQFTKESIIDWDCIVKIRSDYFLVSKELKEILRQAKYMPCFIGVCLGRKKKNFVPSPYLLSRLAKVSKNKVKVNDKGAWMFICSRNIYAKSITNFNSKQKINDLVLVLNKHNECLGHGKVINRFRSKKVAVQNLFDIGDFVRRERKR